MKAKHDTYTIGLCLGGAASMLGTADEQFSKALGINISYLHPRGLDVEIATPVQCAALVGEGLLFKGSNFRQITEILLTQIGKRPLNSKNSDRESYSLCAGMALGLVNLGSGSELPGMADLNMDERLIRFVEGGKQMEELPSMKNNSEQEMCSSVKEGKNVNLYVTLPGAILALTLIHLKSNNKQIAARIELPQTFFALEYSRPNDVLLKVLCKNLIMWDGIQASKTWLESQIPDIIKSIYNSKSIRDVEKKYQTRIPIEEIDFANISVLYTYFLTGALFSIGFKYAGSGNRDVFKFLNNYIEYIIGMKVTNSNKFQPNVAHKYTNANKNDIDQRTYETCLCVTAYAISMVMAGTGDIDCFVTLRRIRKILEKDMHYGFTMAIHMSIGFLFLGSGKYTFSTSNLSIAALLMALYPRFPDSPNDNRYHLQALRHLYVLAIENRLLQSIDIETGELVSVPLEIEYTQEGQNNYVEGNSETRSVKTPIMLEDMQKISRIQLKDKKYYEIIFEKPESIANHQKGTHSVFNKASSLVEKADFAQKSVSKMSNLNPFEVSADQQSHVGWIPRIIYVKKCLPIECENSGKALSGKFSSALAPFEFGRWLIRLLERKRELKDKLTEEEAEGEEDEDEEDNKESSITTAKELNEVSDILSSITKNQLIRKFLQAMCTYDTVTYSELEPLVTKGTVDSEQGAGKYAENFDPEEYFDMMEITEELSEELDGKLENNRIFSKNFYLGILNECFLSNKIEVLPTYIRLFNSSVEYENSENLKNLIKEGKLISTFYKGLYEASFSLPHSSEDDEDDEEMEDVSTCKTKEIHIPEPLLKKDFIAELQEVMNKYNNDEEILSLANLYFQQELDYDRPVDETFEISKAMKNLGSHLSYKNYPYASKMLSTLIILETSQGLSRKHDADLIMALFKQTMGDSAKLIKL